MFYHLFTAKKIISALNNRFQVVDKSFCSNYDKPKVPAVNKLTPIDSLTCSYD